MLIYVASPYTHPDPTVMDARYDAVQFYCGQQMESWRNGVKLYFSPIAYCHPLAVQFKLPREVGYWKELNELIMRRCDHLEILQLPGWEQSKGIQHEISFMMQLGKRYTDVTPNAETLALARSV